MFIFTVSSIRIRIGVCWQRVGIAASGLLCQQPLVFVIWERYRFLLALAPEDRVCIRLRSVTGFITVPNVILFSFSNVVYVKFQKKTFIGGAIYRRETCESDARAAEEMLDRSLSYAAANSSVRRGHKGVGRNEIVNSFAKITNSLQPRFAKHNVSTIIISHSIQSFS